MEQQTSFLTGSKTSLSTALPCSVFPGPLMVSAMKTLRPVSRAIPKHTRLAKDTTVPFTNGDNKTMGKTSLSL